MLDDNIIDLYDVNNERLDYFSTASEFGKKRIINNTAGDVSYIALRIDSETGGYKVTVVDDSKEIPKIKQDCLDMNKKISELEESESIINDLYKKETISPNMIIGKMMDYYCNIIIQSSVVYDNSYVYVQSSTNKLIMIDDSHKRCVTEIPIDANLTEAVLVYIGSSNVDAPSISVIDSDRVALFNALRSTIVSTKYKWLLDNSVNSNIAVIDVAKLKKEFPNGNKIVICNYMSDFEKPRMGFFNGTKKELEWAEVKNSNVKQIEKYFEEEMQDTVNEIIEARTKKSLCFSIITDTHHDPTDKGNDERTKHSIDNITELSRRTFIDGIIHLGDIVMSNKTPLTEMEANTIMNNVRAKLLSGNDKVYICMGNHDGLNGGWPTSRNYAVMSSHNESYVSRIGDNPYYYVDDFPRKVRCIFLCNLTWFDDLGYCINGTDQEQLNWLKSTLANIPNDFDVLVFSHYGLFETTDWEHNLQPVRDALNAFHAHDGEYTGKNGKVIAHICGHTHFDWIVPTSISGVDFPEVVIGASIYTWFDVDQSKYPNATCADRTKGTYTEDLWDTMIWTPSTRILKFIRFGGGENRIIDTNNWDISN